MVTLEETFHIKWGKGGLRFGGFYKNIAYKYYNKRENERILREADFLEFIFKLYPTVYVSVIQQKGVIFLQ